MVVVERKALHFTAIHFPFSFSLFAPSLSVCVDMAHHSAEKLASSSAAKAAVYSIDYHHLQTAYPSLDLSIDTVALPAHQATALYPYELTTTSASAAAAMNGAEEGTEAALKSYNDNIQLLLSHQQVRHRQQPASVAHISV